MLDEKQLAERLNYITGTDAATICGLNPYESIVDLWQYKLRLKAQPDISHLPHIKAGNFLEPVIAQWFEHETGLKTESIPELIRHQKFDWMAGHIDRKVVDKNAILECKTSAWPEGWGENGDNTIPPNYLLQVAHYCAICNVDLAYIAVLIRGQDFRIYTYERNPALEELVIEKEKHFYEYNILKQIPPEPQNTQDILNLYKHLQPDEESIVIASADMEEKCQELREVKSELKKLEEKEAELKKNLTLYMKDKQILLDGFGNRLATFKPNKPENYFDLPQFKADQKELYEQYVRVRPGKRPFLIKNGG